jgi:hypothetical protein
VELIIRNILAAIKQKISWTCHAVRDHECEKSHHGTWMCQSPKLKFSVKNVIY